MCLSLMKNGFSYLDCTESEELLHQVIQKNVLSHNENMLWCNEVTSQIYWREVMAEKSMSMSFDWQANTVKMNVYI